MTTQHASQQVQLPTYAENVALSAFAAARAGRAAIDRYLLFVGRTAANPPHAAVAGE